METLSKHFREITKAAFARYGFAAADAVANWEAIVGPDLAGVSAPERIRWPRGSGEMAQKQGGTLIIRAAPGRALELQYEASRIIARLNGYFGYGAIAAIKVVQAATPPKAPAAPLPLPEKPICEQELGEIDPSPLKDALERLGRVVAASARSSPQGK
ncbi:MAG: DUF721 domain-containing protein [Aestuariivirga sp.]|jgi:hypothetical protein|uniref:DUF721 domain-containing protein n=1 Tax=Aestuariivirga sp. TaxID=2650926 RepID=UPI0038CF7F80